MNGTCCAKDEAFRLQIQDEVPWHIFHSVVAQEDHSGRAFHRPQATMEYPDMKTYWKQDQ